MKPRKIALLAGVFGVLVFAHAGEGTIDIDASKLGAKIPRSLYGIFLEEINNAGEGGLYAELIQNRGFEDANLPPACKLEDGFIVPPRTPHFWEQPKVSDWKMPWNVASAYPGWSLQTSGVGAAEIQLVDDHPLTPASPHALKVSITSSPSVEIVNDGFWGMNVQKGESYNLSFYAQTDGSYDGPVRAVMLGRDGRVLAEHAFASVSGKGWQKLAAKLTATDTDPKGRFALIFPSNGTVWIDFVSLFPGKTFMNRPNGLRPDLAKMIADLKPAFIRYPGGCYVEGLTVETRPHWEQTLGPLEGRTPTYSPWGYWNSNGFGYHEWLQFCEDIHADALYVFNVGVSCAFRSGTFLPDDQVPLLIQNTLDGIEYAVGPTTSKWGALRAKNGHPKPFPLKYVEIGNEQSGPRYGERVGMFYRAIKAKFPQIKIILSSWIAGLDRPAIDAAGKIDIVDEHAYTGAQWAVTHFDSFANYSRTADWDLYIGEFACNGGVGRGNMLATLNDAAYMMSMEKNADLVKMESYAPLLENVNRREWDVNLIHFDSSRAYGRASYYACKLFADNRPDVNLATTVKYHATNPSPIAGPIGLGTFATAAEFKDVRLQQDGKVVYQADLARPDPGWKPRNGRWSFHDGAYVQDDPEGENWTYFGDGYHNLTLTLKAKKIKGAEGFLVSVGNAEGRRVQFNVAGWGNHLHGIEASGVVRQTPGHIDSDRWYEVKVETKGREIQAFLDGALVFHEVLPRSDSVLAIAGRDEKSGEVVLKVLNPGAEPADIKVNLGGIAKFAKTGTLTQLTSGQLRDENTFEAPTKISPMTMRLDGLNQHFAHRFPPYSLSIIRVGTERQ